MLIELPDSLITPLTNTTEEAEVVQLVNDLMGHVLKKHHEVYFGYQFLERILPKFTGLTKIRSALESYRDNWSTNPIPSFITEYIRIIPIQEPERTENINERTVHKVHYTRFLNGEPFSPSKLVCENNFDFRFYLFIANWKQKLENATCQLTFSPFPGGGMTTCDMFQNSIDSNHFTFCVVDSDKRHPNCKKPGDTAKECIKIKFNTSLPYHQLFILHCMEAENLIPLHAIENVEYGGEAKIRKDLLIEKFQNCTQEDLNEILPHYDLKKGFKKNPNFLVKPKWKAYLEHCFSLLRPTEDFKSTLDSALDYDYIISGIKDDILEKSIDWLESNKNITWNQGNMLPFQYTEWNMLGEAMINFGFSASLEATNY